MRQHSLVFLMATEVSTNLQSLVLFLFVLTWSVSVNKYPKVKRAMYILLYSTSTSNVAHPRISCVSQEGWLPNSVRNIYTLKFSEVKHILLVT
jgi:hypothetical protein